MKVFSVIQFSIQRMLFWCGIILLGSCPVQNLCAQSNLIANSGFESGSSGWELGNQWFIWSSNFQGHNSSARYIYFGADSGGSTGLNNGNSTTYQTITVPTNVTSLNLTFWLNVTTSEATTSEYDYLFVEIINISGTILHTDAIYTNKNAVTSGWVQKTTTLSSAYAGQTIQLAFHGVTNASTKTVFRVDDISLVPTYAPPFVQTNAASSITSNSATLNGTANPNGTNTSVYFEYGTTSSYGVTSSSSSLGSGFSNQNFQAILSPLAANTVFHYRSVAKNTYGQTNYGSDVTFKTPQSTGTIRLTVNDSSGILLPVGGMNSVVLFYTSTGASIARQPSSNPNDFISYEYADYRFDVYCWDMLAAQVPSFTHNSSLTSKTVTTLPKRPLSVVVLRSDGNTYLSDATVVIESHNGQTGAWTERARGTTNQTGTYSLNVWPTTVRPAEKYRATVFYNNIQVGSDLDVWVPNTELGRTLGITTTASSPGPTVQTLAASSVTATSAQMNASVNPNGVNTTAYFEFGPTTNYGGKTANFDCGSGTSALSVLNTGSWASNTTFHYRIVATNSGGTSRGDDVTFTTLPATSGPIVSIASPAAASSWHVGSNIPITWTLTGVTASVTGFRVQILNNGVPIHTTSLPATARNYDWDVPPDFLTSVGAVRVETIGTPNSRDERPFVTIDSNPSILIPIIIISHSSPIPLNQEVTFSAASSRGPITSYHWRFSDGTTKEGVTAKHIFKSSQDGYGYVELFLNSLNSPHKASFRFALTGGGVDDKQGKQGDPVNTATGSFIYNLDLMPVAARGLPFLFQAYYSSQSYREATEDLAASAPGALGHGWTHTFETNIQAGTENGKRYALIAFGDGHAEKFTQNDGVSWSPEAGNYNQLSEGTDGRFQLLTRSLLNHSFDLNGRLDAITDRNGNSLEVVWEPVPNSSLKRIQKVILAGGPADGSAKHEIIFHYRETLPTFLWKLEDPMHEQCEFTQDTNGNLVSYANELNHPTLYTYDASHQMLTITDAEAHRVVHLFYNADRRVDKQEDASGNVTLFSYNFPANGGAGDRITTVTRLADPSYATADPRNEVVEDVHDQKLYLIERRVRVENPNLGDSFIWLTEKLNYDPLTGNLISKINRRGYETIFQYENGNLIQVSTPDAATTTFEYGDADHPTLPTLITYPDPRVKERLEYDAKGNLIATTKPYDPTQPNKYRRRTVRDEFGQISSTVDANGVTQSFEMDEWGRNTSYTDGELKPHITEVDANGRKTASIDPRNNRVTFVLNKLGNLTSSRRNDPNDPINPIITEVSYDDTELLIQSTDPLNHFSYSVRDEQGRVVREENHERHPLIHRFDAFGREVETENAKGGITRRTFNFAGYLLSESSPAPSTNVITYKRDANGNATEIVDGDGVRTTIEYDSMDRPIVTKRWKSVTEFDQTRTSYSLLGQKEWDEDQQGVKTYYHYNLAGDHIRTVSKSGTEFTFDYDNEGNLTSASHTSSSGLATRYQEYNGRYQLKKRIDENGYSEEFFYDDAGNLERHVQESNSATPLETTFAHDSLNRLTRINPPTGPPITFKYDKASRRVEMTDLTGTTKWDYSTLNQVASIEMPNGLKLSFSYDPLGATQIITYPGNRPATYVTDAAGRFQSVTDWASRTISQTYTAGDRPLRLQFPNGVHTDLAHDPLGRLNVVTHQKGSDPALRHLSYGFNALGQVVSIPDVQLPELESAYPCTYGKANELLTIAGSPVTHDGRGNLKTAKLSTTSPATDTLTWDYANRLTSGSIGGAPFTNTFNGLGHRTATTRSGVTTGFLHDDRDAMPRIMAETDGAVTPTAFYLYAGDTLLARILPDGSALWYHPDRQGNIVLLTDGSGSTAADYQYDPFGVLASASGSFAASNRFRYLGGLGVWDNDDGTLHARARSYHPRLGSFLSYDPLFGRVQDGQSLNRYVYAMGDPFVFSDPSGFKPVHGLLYSDIERGMESGVLSTSLPSSDNISGEILIGLGEGIVGRIVAQGAVYILTVVVGAEAASVIIPTAVLVGGVYAIRQWVDSNFDITPRGVGNFAGGAVPLRQLTSTLVGKITLPFKSKALIQFGGGANQNYHTFKHVEEAGLDKKTVQIAVEAHLTPLVSNLKIGELFSGTIRVAGQTLKYNAFKLQDGTINVGRIHTIK